MTDRGHLSEGWSLGEVLMQQVPLLLWGEQCKDHQESQHLPPTHQLHKHKFKDTLSINNLKKNAFSVGHEFKFSYNNTFQSWKIYSSKMTDGFKIRHQII